MHGQNHIKFVHPFTIRVNNQLDALF